MIKKRGGGGVNVGADGMVAYLCGSVRHITKEVADISSLELDLPAPQFPKSLDARCGFSLVIARRAWPERPRPTN